MCAQWLEHSCSCCFLTTYICWYGQQHLRRSFDKLDEYEYVTTSDRLWNARPRSIQWASAGSSGPLSTEIRLWSVRELASSISRCRQPTLRSCAAADPLLQASWGRLILSSDPQCALWGLEPQSGASAPFMRSCRPVTSRLLLPSGAWKSARFLAGCVEENGGFKWSEKTQRSCPHNIGWRPGRWERHTE
jgi:hypothetical protein